MEKVKQNKLLLWAVLILFITNVATLAAVWITKAAEKEKAVLLKQKNEKNHKSFKHKLFAELELDTIQAKQLQAMRRAHFGSLHILKDSIRFYKECLHNELFCANPDARKIDDLADSIGDLNAEFERLNYEHFLQVKKVLDVEQQQKFKTLLEDAALRPDRIHRHRHRHRGGK